jgi:DNA-binding transcriptional regulator YiaG
MTPAEFKALRDAWGLSQTAMADRLGVSRRAIQTWEAGERAVPAVVVKLIDAYKAYDWSRVGDLRAISAASAR